MLEDTQANTAYNKKSVRKPPHPFYVLIIDADDGEVRVTRYVDAKNYDGIADGERSTVYFGTWSILHKTQDREKLIKYARLLTNDKGTKIADHEAEDDSYWAFLPEEHHRRKG